MRSLCSPTSSIWNSKTCFLIGAYQSKWLFILCFPTDFQQMLVNDCTWHRLLKRNLRKGWRSMCVNVTIVCMCVFCSGFQNEFVILPVAFCVICTFVVLCLLNLFHVWILCCLSRSQVFNLHGVVGEEVKAMEVLRGCPAWLVPAGQGGDGWDRTGGYPRPVVFVSVQIPNENEDVYWRIYSVKWKGKERSLLRVTQQIWVDVKERSQDHQA